MKKIIKTKSIIISVAFFLLIVLILTQRVNYYKNIMQLQLDPLGEKYPPSFLRLHEDSFWIIGDSRAEQWDTTYFNSMTSGVLNLGVGGQSSKQVLERFKNDLEIAHPERILIQVGINDLKCLGIIKDNNITKNCIDNIINILEICKEEEINAVYSSIFPVGRIEVFRRPFWTKDICDSINKVNITLKNYCVQNGFLFFDSYSLLLNDNTSKLAKQEYQKDFLHLNKKGYVVLSKELENFFHQNNDTQIL